MTHRAEIERRALEIAAEVDQKEGPYYAEILPHETPRWHIVRTAPGQENKATKFLADRRFGVALPRFVKGSRLIRGHEVSDLSEQLIFPGRVFVFVWGVLTHWHRIIANPGVQSIMCIGNEKPAVMPDDQMARILKLEFELAIPRPKRRKRYWSWSQDMITITSADYLHVDGIKRNRVLDAVLLRAA
jgi:transcription antitermination factor NusG